MMASRMTSRAVALLAQPFRHSINLALSTRSMHQFASGMRSHITSSDRLQRSAQCSCVNCRASTPFSGFMPKRRYTDTIDAVQLNVGLVIEHEGGLYLVTSSHSTRQAQSKFHIVCDLKNIETGNKINHRFISSDRIKRVYFESKSYQFLYQQGDILFFMDQKTFEQLELPSSIADEAQLPYFADLANFEDEVKARVVIESHNDRPLRVKLPRTVVCVVKRLDRTSGGWGTATLTNGKRLLVPPSVTEGQRILVNTESHEYSDRAEKSSGVN